MVIDKETHQIESKRGYREMSLAQPNVTVHRKKNFSCLCLFDSFTGEETAGSDSRCLCPTEPILCLAQRVDWGESVNRCVLPLAGPIVESTYSTCFLNFLEVACCVFVPECQSPFFSPMPLLSLHVS